MGTSAVIMMVLFLLVIWGGMALSIRHFVTHPDDVTELDDSAAASPRNG